MIYMYIVNKTHWIFKKNEYLVQTYIFILVIFISANVFFDVFVLHNRIL